jgi:hypothetical protein
MTCQADPLLVPSIFFQVYLCLLKLHPILFEL